MKEKLQLSVKWNDGILHVHIVKAIGLRNPGAFFGKLDPYASCYLLDDHGESFFQPNNKKTKTCKKTLDPEWNHDFEFRVSILTTFVSPPSNFTS